MNPKLKFIHTADIHLGRPLSFAGNPSQELLDIFNKAGENALKNLVDKSIEYEVDFIIIAGDLYDLEARSVKSSRFFLEQCRRLKKENIPVYIISGNHDPAAIKREPFEMPANVHFFSSENAETKFFRKNNLKAARIIGQSYREKFESRSMYNYYTAPDKALFNIGVIHTGLDKENNRYVPLSKSDLISKSEIHYWALGHIHQNIAVNNASPAIHYPGTIQGRDINEVGEKGCLLVNVDQNLNMDTKFMHLSPVIFKNINIDINDKSEIKKISDLEKILIKKAKNILDDFEKKEDEFINAFIVRWIIKGRTEINQYIKDNRKEVEDNILSELRRKFADQRPFIWSHSLVLRTADNLPQLDELKKNNKIFKEIDDLIKEIMKDDKLNEELIDEWGKIWQGSREDEDRESERFFADKDLKKEILDEAEKIIISEIIEGGDLN